MLYEVPETNHSLPVLLMERSEYAPNLCAFRNDEYGAWLYHANTIEFMDLLIAKFPQGKFDMIFADPPYFLSNGGITCHAGKMIKVDKGQWDKSSGPDMNHEFNISWLSRCQKLLVPNGTLWVSGTHHSIHSVGFAMQQLGMKILNDITWEKPNPPPNLSCRYFTHSTETIIWAAKNEKSKHIFNYDQMRENNGGKQMKSVWSFTAPLSGEKIFGKHPTQKPVALLERIIESSTLRGDLVFDPFAGSSTTGVAAIKLQRKFVGVELESDFIQLSKKRLEDAIQGYQSLIEFEPKKRWNMERKAAINKLNQLVGVDLIPLAHDYGITVWKGTKKNKGWAGHVIERYLGLPLNSAQSPNFGSWELKVVPLKKSTKGNLIVKETMAITMLDRHYLQNTPFEQSHLLAKLQKVVICARLFESVEENHSVLFSVSEFDLDDPLVYEQVRADYEEVRACINSQGFDCLTGKMGKLIQPRTKGAGHGSTSRAFYARTPFLAAMIGISSQKTAH